MNDKEKETVEELKKQLRLAINIDDVTTTIRNDDAEAILNLIEKLQKENEELNNRCRNLDKEAQAYLEELAGDNTLTRRNIKQLQEENEELKKDYYNVINKIENKIDILDIAISECIYIDDDDKAYKKAVKKDKLCLLNQKRALQELLEGEKNMTEEEKKAIKTIEEFRDYYAREDIHKEDFNNNQSYEKALSEIRQLRNNFDTVLNLITKLQKKMKN
jgi:hypothetical protein